MSVERNKANTRRLLERMFVGDFAILDELMAPDAVHANPLSPGLGAVQVRELLETLRRGFPDLAMTVGVVIGEDDHTAARWTAVGTHDGPFLTMSPTRKRVAVSGLWLVRWRDGRVVQLIGEWNLLSLLAQLGVTSGTPPVRS